MTSPLVLLPATAEPGALPVAQWEWANAARTGPVTVVVPAQALSWHRVQLPAGVGKQSQRLRNVLEGLLEDQLLDEPAAMHFALEPSPPTSGPVWIAACARDWLRHCLQLLERAGHPIGAVVPEWAPQTETAEAADTVWLTSLADGAQAVWVDARGVHRRPLSLQHGHAATWPASWPAQTILAEPALATLAEALNAGEVHILPRDERLLRCAQSPWDLAQADMARSAPWIRRLQRHATTLWQAPQWRPARWALAAVLMAQLVGLNAAAWQARQQLSQQRTAINNILLTSFPKTPVVIDAPRQMEQAVTTLRQTSGQATPRDLESMLGTLGSLEAFEAFAPEKGRLAAIEFIAGDLRMRGLTLPPGGEEKLQAQLQLRGYALRQDGDTVQLSPRTNP